MNPIYYQTQLEEKVLNNPAATPTEKALAQLVMELAKEVHTLNRREHENSEQLNAWIKNSR